MGRAIPLGRYTPRRAAHIALLLAAACLSTGCLRLTFTLNLKPDGSGTIAQTIGVDKAAFAAAMGTLAPALDVKDAKAGPGPIPFLTDEEVKATAAALGARFVSLKPSADPALEGQTATFAFDDIRKLPLDLDVMLGSAFPRPKTVPPDSGKVGVAFTREGGRSILVLEMPEIGEAAFKEAVETANPGGEPAIPDFPPDTAKMMGQMLDGFYVELAINLEGTIVPTDAPFVDGTKVVLLRMDFSEMLKAGDLGEIAMKMQATPPGGVEKQFEIPGLKIATPSTIRIEFR